MNNVLRAINQSLKKCAGCKKPIANQWWRLYCDECYIKNKKGNKIRAELPMTADPNSELIEKLASQFHQIYQDEAKRQGDVRHADKYEDLSENIKEFDRVLARYVLENFVNKQRLQELLKKWYNEAGKSDHFEAKVTYDKCSQDLRKLLEEKDG